MDDIFPVNTTAEANLIAVKIGDLILLFMFVG